jgi:hypothetical protein
LPPRTTSVVTAPGVEFPLEGGERRGGRQGGVRRFPVQDRRAGVAEGDVQRRDRGVHGGRLPRPRDHEPGAARVLEIGRDRVEELPAPLVEPVRPGRCAGDGDGARQAATKPATREAGRRRRWSAIDPVTE